MQVVLCWQLLLVLGLVIVHILDVQLQVLLSCWCMLLAAPQLLSFVTLMLQVVACCLLLLPLLLAGLMLA